MKREFGNKDFLPYKLIEKKEKELNKGSKLLSMFFIITSIILFPIFIDSILGFKDKVKKTPIFTQEETTYSKDSIVKWIDILNGVTEGNIKDLEGTLIINGNKNLEELVMNQSITIKSLESLGDEKFKVVVRGDD